MSDKKSTQEILKEDNDSKKPNNELTEAFDCISDLLKKSTARKDEKIELDEIFAALKELEVSALMIAKAELRVQLNAILKPTGEEEKEQLKKQLGGGKLYVRQGGDPNSTKSTDLLPFRWIEVTYERTDEDDTYHKENYNLALSQQLLDTTTGNTHTAFGKLQFWHNLLGDAQVGDGGKRKEKVHPNEFPVKHVEEKHPASNHALNKGKNYYFLKYFAEKAYPIALIYGCRDRSALPWGLDKLEDWSETNLELDDAEKKLQLDMAHPDYKPEQVAKTFIYFVMKDLTAKGIIPKK
ncbi:MAG: hypothetical protein JJE36_02390 [Coriobacteriia bacterium]|nr:hypothetical protein [Coriobacteriia bacterium]